MLTIFRKIRALLAIRFVRRALLVICILGVILALLIWRELVSSGWQAYYLSRLAKELTFQTEPGPNPSLYFPRTGPYDERLGYTRLPQVLKKLSGEAYGFIVSAQARVSKKMEELTDWGIFPIYHEKTRVGLSIFDRADRPLFTTNYPERTYASFDTIPPLILNTLLYIENRELLDNTHPKRNPAIEWDRLIKATFELSSRIIKDKQKSPGGSTIATQLEKYRHSPEGRTSSPKEKLQQMASASIRAYLDGEETFTTRQHILLDYINSIPLAALGGFGEVNGLGDGLWAWYDADFNEVNRLLTPAEDPKDPAELNARADAYIKILSLFLAHRRPSSYLIKDRAELKELTDTYLRLLRQEGVISEALFAAAEKLPLPFRTTPVSGAKVSFLERKAANLIRTDLLSIVDLKRLYELDRFDLKVKTSIDVAAQQAVTETLRKMRDPKFLRSQGLIGNRVLDQQKDPNAVIYSFTLYEKGDQVNLLRVETDSYDQPFNINQGVKLDLGSTAKLRTLITYLQIVSELYNKLSLLNATDLKKIKVHPADNISEWAIAYMLNNRQRDLTQMLEASLDREYSASPAEVFFTGGGQHTFENFNKEDNGKTLPLRIGFRHSVNLVFIRLMRDVVNYYMHRDLHSTGNVLEDMKNLSRKDYLAKFADKEGSQFLLNFYRKYKDRAPREIIALVLEGVRKVPFRYAAVFRALRPNDTFEQFSSFLLARFPESHLGEDVLKKLFTRYDKAVQNLPDRGFIARIHPLELWLAGFLLDHPGATYKDALQESTSARQEVYNWLFSSRDKAAQNTRIRIVMETEAFREIHKAWRELGYPFEFLVPSYASSIGSSADKPAALAELMGILVNNGMRYPSVHIQELQFGAGTPYETVLKLSPPPVNPVLKPEIAAVVRKAITDIVEHGTAQRAYKAFPKKDGTYFTVGGKTGTGDHRYKTFGPGGALKEARVVNRTATFVFFIGDRFFGTITAYVPGQEAANYKFTSALPVQLLKALAPTLTPFLEQ